MQPTDHDADCRLATVQLTVIDWRAVHLALTRAAAVHPDECSTAMQVGRAQLRHIAQHIAAAVEAATSEGARDAAH